MKISYFFKREWIIPSLRMAFIVGSILFIINHGHALINNNMSIDRWLSAVLSYLVPYCVYIFGKASVQKKEQS